MRFLLLGTAQDGGVPHVGCRCPTCTSAREDPALRRLAPSAAVVDPAEGRAWLLDASPDLPLQLEALKDAMGPEMGSGIPLSAVLLTHLHVGHYWGLGFLGREGMMARGLPVLAPPEAARVLRTSRPFRDMLEWGALDIRAVRPGETLLLAEGLAVVGHPVPHRADVSDTYAWTLEGDRAKVVYVPDLDELDDPALELVRSADVALVDGTFYGTDEIPGVTRTVPHPPVEATMDRLGEVVEGGTRVVYTHLNHTNPLCDPGSAETGRVQAAGFEVAYDGMAFEI